MEEINNYVRKTRISKITRTCRRRCFKKIKNLIKSLKIDFNLISRYNIERGMKVYREGIKLPPFKGFDGEDFRKRLINSNLIDFSKKHFGHTNTEKCFN